MNSISGKWLIAVLFALVGSASFGLWWWASHTPVPQNLTARQPGKPIPGLLN
jgi:hypothetical protein